MTTAVLAPTVPDPDELVVYNAVTGMPSPMRDAIIHDCDDEPYADPAWWTCPKFCDRRCHGGDTYPLGDGIDLSINRVHTHHWLDDDGIKLVDEQGEDVDGNYGQRKTVLYVDRQAIEITPTMAVRLADALHQIAT